MRAYVRSFGEFRGIAFFGKSFVNRNLVLYPELVCKAVRIQKIRPNQLDFERLQALVPLLILLLVHFGIPIEQSTVATLVLIRFVRRAWRNRISSHDHRPN